ncbi:MAG TPA: protein kinase [Candidatus Angelobacter sp.]|jgi:serine/threonine protein kinase/tetratricopeptide (TPR) repeat protein|nr:protein kinase [Candidatus Angelobacter sp.]
MDSARWRQVKEVLHTAIELEPVLRSRYLSQACSSDPDLRAEVESLLEAHEQVSSGFMETLPVLQIPRLETGAQLGPYKIVSFIAAGGMGEVYRASDTRLSRDVAIKVLPGVFTSEAERLRRFEQEARAAALNHPNIMAIFDIGNHQGSPFIVSELLEGESLRECLESGPLPIERALDYGLQLSRGLAAAHSKGIIHCDLKPENIFITSKGEAKILDFGLAKLPSPSPSDFGATSAETGPGMFAGTVGYMSPEQLRAQRVDKRSDIFSLGAILCEMLTGNKAFSGVSPADSVSATLNKEPNELARLGRDLSLGLATLIERCLEKERDRRFQSAEELTLAFESVQAECRQGVFLGSLQVWRLRIAVFAACIITLAFWAGWKVIRQKGDHQRVPIQSLVVLPLINLSGDPNEEYLADGMTDALIADLAKVGSFRVISRTSAMHYKDTRKRLPEIAHELNDVDAVIEGSVARSGGRIRVTAQLIVASTDQHLWSENYERKIGDIGALQAELARTVTKQIAAALTSQQEIGATRPQHVSPEFEELYLKGQYYLNQGTTDGIQLALQYFKEAIEKEPDNALGYVGIAQAHSQSIYVSGTLVRKALPLVKAAATKALQLDDSLAEAHGLLALAMAYYDRDWSGAEVEFQSAIRLNAGSSIIHLNYGNAFLTPLGRHKEAVVELKKAVQLDPLSPVVYGILGWDLFFARQYDQAIEQYHKALELDPNLTLAHWGLMEVYEQKGSYSEAISEFQQTVTSMTGRSQFIESIRQSYATAGVMGYWKRRQAWLEGLRKGGISVTAELAMAYAKGGKKDLAFDLLDEADLERQSRSNFLDVDPGLDSLRKDSRFAELKRRLHLPIHS